MILQDALERVYGSLVACASNTYALDEDFDAPYEEPPLPDRSSYQRQMSALCDNLKPLENRRLALLGSRARVENGVLREAQLGEISVLSQQIAAARKDKIKYKYDYEQACSRLSTLTKLKETHLSVVRACEDDSDLVFKVEGKLEHRLAQLRLNFEKSTLTNAKEEQRFVQEIDKLKRNKSKLPKYLNASKDLRRVDEEIKQMKEQKGPSHRNQRKAAFQLQQLSSQRRKLKAELDSLRHEHTAMVNQKKTFIADWEKRVNAFKAWRTHKKLSSSNGLTAIRNSKHEHGRSKSAHHSLRNDVTSVGYDSDEDLVPFAEEKHSCSVLLDYLNRLLAQTLGHMHEQTGAGCSAQQTSSAHGHGGVSYAQAVKQSLADSSSEPDDMVDAPRVQKDSHAAKKRCQKRSYKRADQAISHSLEMYRAFEGLGLSPPATYGQLKESVEQVEMVINDLQNRTKLQVDVDDLESLYSAAPSDLTDSAWGSITSTDMSFSDCASLTPSDLVSPDCSLPASALNAHPFGPAAAQDTQSDGDVHPALECGSPLFKRPTQPDPTLQRSVSAEGHGQSDSAALSLQQHTSTIDVLVDDEGIDTACAVSKDSSVNSTNNMAALSITAPTNKQSESDTRGLRRDTSGIGTTDDDNLTP